VTNHLKALSFTRELSFFFFFSFFYQSTVLSSRAVDGHQMYSRGSVLGEVLTIDRDLAHPSLIFTGGGSKSAIFDVVFKFEPPENAAKYSNSEIFLRSHDRPMTSPRQVWWSWVHASLRKLCQF